MVVGSSAKSDAVVGSTRTRRAGRQVDGDPIPSAHDKGLCIPVLARVRDGFQALRDIKQVSKTVLGFSIDGPLEATRPLLIVAFDIKRDVLALAYGGKCEREDRTLFVRRPAGSHRSGETV